MCIRFRIEHIKSKVYECNRVDLFGSSMSVLYIFLYFIAMDIIVDIYYSATRLLGIHDCCGCLKDTCAPHYSKKSGTHLRYIGCC